MTLSDETVATVKATVPALRAHGGDIVLTFYDTLFARYPHVRAYFNTDRQKGGVTEEGGLPMQVSRLANAVMAYAKNIDNVPAIMPAVERIAQRHVVRGVEAPHYDAVGECLLHAMRVVLADAATDRVMAAWADAYALLADTFVATERRLRRDAERAAGYAGLAPMRVVSVADSDAGRRIGLVPRDVPVPPHADGMFVAVALTLDSGEKTMTTMDVVGDDSHVLTIFVPTSEEKATKFLLASVKEGTTLDVSVPCGKPN